MTAQQSTRKNITRQLVASCTPDKSFYIGEYATWVRAIIDNVEKSIGKPLTPKQVERILESL
jgi:hypothetical protein